MKILREMHQARASGTGGGGGGGISTAAQKMTGLAYNFSNPAYYGDVFPWMNLLHSGPGFDPGAFTYASTGWPVGIANAGSATAKIIFSQDATFSWLPPGDYQISGTTGFHFDLAGGSSTGLTNVTLGTSVAPTCFFTIPDLGSGSYGGITIYARAINHSGGTLNLTSMYVGKVSSYSAWVGGEIYDPLFLADIAGCNAVRIQGWADQNQPLYDAWDTTVLNDEANVVWKSGQAAIPRDERVPWSVAAKLAKKMTELNGRTCVLWACLNSGNEGLFYNAYDIATGTFTSARPNGLPQTHLYVENQPVVFYNRTPSFFAALPTDQVTPPSIYYAHPVTATTFQLKASPGGGVITGGTFTYDGANWDSYSLQSVPETAKALAYFTTVANQIKAAYPACMVMVEVGNEPWNFGYHATYYYNHAMAIPAAGGTSGAIGGAPVGSWIWAQQRAWKAFEAVFGRDNIARGTSGWTANYDQIHYGLTYVDPEGIIQAGKQTWELSDLHYLDTYTWMSIDGVHEMSAEFDGMNTLFNAGASTAPDTTLTSYYLLGNSIVKPRLISHLSQLHALAPGKKVVAYEGGEGSWCNGFTANQTAMMQRVKAYLSTAESVNFINDFVQKCLIDSGISMHCQYTAAGAWSNPVTKWGLKRGHQLGDNPSAARIKTIVPPIS